MRYTNDIDPLALAMAPPPNETPSERLAREEKEEQARQVSKRIDLELKVAKSAMKKMQSAVRVLVLGQSMSGKTTTIKNFQMTYAQKSWAEERDSWKAVILLNLARSVNTVADVVGAELNIVPEDSGQEQGPHVGLTEQHRSLILRLAPLRQIERDLEIFLGSGSTESDSGADKSQSSLERTSPHEFALRSNTGWKTILDHIRNPNGAKDRQLQRVASEVIISLKDDICALWKDSTVQKIIRKRKFGLEDTPGFFLQDVDRLARPDYVPSDADVVRARLRTTGVQEYHFTLDRGTPTALDWLMYDVAGTRTSASVLVDKIRNREKLTRVLLQRAAWIPYFKDITAIIFLAPLSAFNEMLLEDTTTNSVHDSFSLWQTVCSSKLLANVQIILFMNKTDLLQKKLNSGLIVRKYLPEYQEKDNDFATVTTWFRRMFSRIYKKYSPPGRKLNAHFTSVIDTRATAQTLAAVQSVILRNDVIQAGLM